MSLFTKQQKIGSSPRKVAGITAGPAESNGSLPPGYDSRHLQADCQEPGSAPEPTLGNQVWASFTYLSDFSPVRRCPLVGQFEYTVRYQIRATHC